MKKLKTKKKIFIIVILLILFAGAVGIYAASKYYRHIWTHEVTYIEGHNEYITNDIIEDNGYFIAVGHDSTGENYKPTFVVYDENGKFVKEVDLTGDYEFVESGLHDSYNGGIAKKIVKNNDKYLVLTIWCFNRYLIEINEDFEVEKIYSYSSFNNIFYGSFITQAYETFLEEDEEYYYVFGGDQVDYTILRIEKANLSNYEFFAGPYFINNNTDRATYNYEGKVLDLYNIYSTIYNSSIQNRTINDSSYTFEPRFVSKVNDYYLMGIYNSSLNTSILFLYDPNTESDNLEDKILWELNLEGRFVNTAIEFNGKILIADNQYLEMYDLEGNSLGKDELSNYLQTDETNFIVEHLIAVGDSGFALTGSAEVEVENDTDNAEMGNISSNNSVDENGIPLLPDGSTPPEGATENDMKEAGVELKEEPSSSNAITSQAEMGDIEESSQSMIAEVLYFNIYHNIYTKTDGNGTIESNKTEAGWGEEITFTITPKEGFKLKEVKVTDSNGNTITFTDYIFSMPNADVTIEATFYVENPETYVFLGITIITLLVISGILIVHNKNKIK